MRVYDSYVYVLFFFFQAEDGIRDYKVTGVQTCALPISALCGKASCPKESANAALALAHAWPVVAWCRKRMHGLQAYRDAGSSRRACCQIGRASCRERG